MAFSVRKYVSAFVDATAGQVLTLGAPSSDPAEDTLLLPPGFDHADILVEEVAGHTTLGFTSVGSTANFYQPNASASPVSLADGAVDASQTNCAVALAELFSSADCTGFGRFGIVSALTRSGAGNDQRLTSTPARSLTLTLKRDATVGTGTYRVTVWVYAHETVPGVPATLAATAA